MQQILAIVGVIASLSTVTVALPRWEATRHNAVGFESTSEYQPTGYYDKYSTPYSSSKTSPYYPELSKIVKNPSSEASTYTDVDAFGEGELETEGSDGYTNDRYLPSSASYQEKPYSYQQEAPVVDDVYGTKYGQYPSAVDGAANEEPAYDNEYPGDYKNEDNGAVAADEEEYPIDENEYPQDDDNEYSGEYKDSDNGAVASDEEEYPVDESEDLAAEDNEYTPADDTEDSSDDASFEEGADADVEDADPYDQSDDSAVDESAVYENGDDTAVYEESNDVADETAPAKYGRYSSGKGKYSFYPVENSAAESPIKASEYFPHQYRRYSN